MSNPPASDEREERLHRLARALARHLPEPTARELIEKALEQAGLDSVPPAVEVPAFVERHLAEVLAVRVGPSVTEHWLKSLRTELARDPTVPLRPSVPQPDTVSASIDAWLGRVLAGRYRVLQKAGEGRRGSIYRAERVDDGVRVAVKLVHPAVYQSQSGFEARLAYEVGIARARSHPNTLQVFEFGRADERWMFVAMEWLSGIDLARMLKTRGALTGRQAMHLAFQAARSLSAAHAQDVVHGDLTPESLFVARLANGHSVVKVMDYGRRRLAAYNEEGHSQVGLPRGWARYLAPEQIGGDDFDARADVYALGAILYEALSGELPFQDSTGIGILMSQVYEQPPPLRSRERAKELPESIEKLVMRSLAKDPAERFASMDELAMIAYDLAK